MTRDVTHTLVGGQVLIGVHEPDERCAKRCPIHNPSNHHMRDWPQDWRPDLRIIERICSHGIGHPDPDDIRAKEFNKSHGCDGCCSSVR